LPSVPHFRLRLQKFGDFALPLGNVAHDISLLSLCVANLPQRLVRRLEELNVRFHDWLENGLVKGNGPLSRKPQDRGQNQDWNAEALAKTKGEFN
jgi:hypothetical protein